MPPQLEQSRTLSRGLRVLRALEVEHGGLSVTELADSLGTHRAVIYRLLRPLIAERLVARTEQGRYTLGLGLVELASGVRSELQSVAVHELRILADDVRATTALTVRDSDEAVVLLVAEPRSTNMHISYRPGLRHPITVAASGLAILAGSPATPNERVEVSKARRLGYAVTTGELLGGATGVAAPIVLRGRPAEASISAVWIEPRKVEAIAGLVVEAARRVAGALE